MHNPNDFLYPQTTANKIAVGLGLTAAPTGIKLLDISENQSRSIVNYFPQLIADGYGGIIVRATDGMIKDKSFDYFYPAILDAGLTVQVYGAMYASRNGTDQAKFLADTVSELLEEVDGNLVAWNDGETSDGVPVQTHRVELLRWLAEASKVFRKVGAYGSLKTWQEIYGNLTLPSQFYFWNAQWRSGTVYTLPAGITQAQLVFWQNGVWPKYAWGEQPDNLPEAEDVDLNVMPGKTMADLREFTEQDEIVPPPTPFPPHTHPEIEAKINALAAALVSVGNRVTELEEAIVYFKVTADVANANRVKSLNGAGKPIMVLTDPRVQYPKDARVQIIPYKVDADGTVDYFKIVGQDLYLREQDGYVELY